MTKNAAWYRQRAPLWWVMREARAGNADAAAELLRRMELGAVPRARDPQIERLMIEQIEAQAPLDGAWGDLLAHAVSTGVLTQAQRERLIRSSHTFTTHVRRLHRSGDRITFAIEDAPVYDRFLLSRLGVGEMGLDLANLYIGDEDLDPAAPRRGVSWITYSSGSSLPSPSGSNTRLSVSPRAPDGSVTGPLPVGEHRISILFTPRYDDITLPMKHTHTIEVVPDSTQIVKLVAFPPEGIQEFLDSFSIASLRVSTSSNGTMASLAYSIDSPPIPFAATAVVRFGGAEIQIGELIVFPGDVRINTGQVVPDHLLHPPPELASVATRVDVIFRASARTAERNSNFEQVWDGEVVFRDVPVERVSRTELYTWSSSTCVYRPEGASPEAP